MSRRILPLAALLGLASCSCSCARPPPARVEVIVAAPGLSVAEVEATVAPPIEEALAAIPGRGALRSESRPGGTIVSVTLQGSELEAVSRARAALEAVRARLPAGAEAPLVRRPLPEGTPRAWAIAGAAPPETLRRAGERLRDRLERVTGVYAVELCAGADEVTVELDPEALARLGLAATEVLAALAAGEGSGAHARPSLPLTAGPGTPEPPDLTRPIAPGVRLSDVATVRGGEAPDVCRARAPRAAAATLLVRAAVEADRSVAAEVDDAIAALPPGLALVPLAPSRAHRVLVPPGAALEHVAAQLASALGPDAPWLLEVRPPGELRLLPHAAAAAPPALPPGLLLRPARPADVVVRVIGADRAALHEVAARLADALAQVPGAQVTPPEPDRPVHVARIDRDAAAALGVRVSELATAYRLATTGVPLDGAAVARLAAPGPASASRLLVRDASGLVPLGRLVSVEARLQPASLHRVERARALELAVHDARPSTLRDALAAVPLPAGVAVELEEVRP